MNDKSIENVTGYCTITYKLRVYTNHFDYLKMTKEIFNQVVLNYYNLLLNNLDFLNLSNQYCLRELEILTIQGKDGKKPKYDFEIDIPSQLRRSAINHAIGSVRSFVALQKNYEEKITENPKYKGKAPTETKKFDTSPIFYKGMYKEFSNESIKVKLWNGYKWDWYTLKLTGREIKEDMETLSPAIVINSKFIMLHIPIKLTVKDVTPVKERMKKESLKICSVTFSNVNNFAVAIILDKDRKFVKSKFIKGANEFKNNTSKILSKINKDRKANFNFEEKDHKKDWEKLNKICENTAHKVSKEIIDFCLENEVTVISIAKIEDDVNGFTKKIGKYSALYLKRRIVEFLKYKAFKNGIMITTVRQNYTASKCYECRANIKRNNNLYTCENGHSGNYYFNTAMNIGLMCLKKFGM